AALGTDASDAASSSADAADANPTPLTSAVLLFAGDGPQFFGDTWEWDGKRWLAWNVTAPSARYDHATAALNGKIVLFGGMGVAGYLGDTWEWDGSTWTERKVP